MSEKTVLQFNEVEYRSDAGTYASFGGASFALQAGGVLALHLDHDSEHVPLLDLATGLLAPTSGTVCFMEKTWSERDAFEQATARGRIGSVLEKEAWISNLTVKQNIVLRERHHTLRNEEEIEAEADMLCKMAGMNEIPSCRPDRVRPRELRMLEWVRAFMGSPALVLLAFPSRDALSSGGECLLALVKRHLATGGAVVWISDQEHVWRQPLLDSACHYKIVKERWTSLKKGEY